MKFVEELLELLRKHNAYIRSDCQTGCDLVVIVEGIEVTQFSCAITSHEHFIPYRYFR